MPKQKLTRKSRSFDPHAMAHWLVNAHARREAFTQAPASIRANNQEEAIAVQQSFVKLKSLQCGPAVGWKIALSTPVMQHMVGLDAPVAARLHKKQIVRAPAQTALSSYTRLIVEFEIAVRLGRDLKVQASPHTASSVKEAVGFVAPAIEIADDRMAVYPEMHDKGLELLADNAWNEGVILGPERSVQEALTSLGTEGEQDGLARMRGQVHLNGQLIGSGRGADLMGHPLEALAWLANAANERGEYLKRGQLCILGSLVSSKFPKLHDHFRFELDGFEPIELSVV
jgi:2-keto-4-pentenoate hydratase